MKPAPSISTKVSLTLLLLAAAACLGPAPYAQADQLLTNNTSASQLPRIVADQGYLHVVYQDNFTGKEEVYYKRSTNNGDTWSNAVQISSGDNANSVTPSIAAQSGTVHVVWSDYNDPVDARILHARCANNGDDWLEASPTITRTVIPYPWYSCYGPSVAASDNGNVHVVYHNHAAGNYEVYYVRSSNNGASFGSPVNLSLSNTDSQAAKVAAYNYTYVYVVWQENHDGAVEVYYRASVNSGASWPWSPGQLSGGPGTNSLGPEVAARCSRAAVVWYDYRGTDVRVYFRHTSSNDQTNGPVWAEEKWIGGESFYGSAYYPSVTLWYTAGHSYVVWQHPVSVGGNYEIYGNKTVNYGGQWTPGKSGTRLTDNSGDSMRPVIATDTGGSDVHMVWQDKRDGDWDIWYKRIDNRSGFAPGVAVDLESGSPSPLAAGDLGAVAGESVGFHRELTAEPNPFRANTTIRYTVFQAAPVSLRIYDMSGRLVRILLEERQAAGEHAAVWDGRDGDGRVRQNGVYLCTVGSRDRRECGKIMLLR